MAKINIKGAIIDNGEKWIYDYFDIPSCCPKDVETELEKAKGEKVDVYINSNGGSVFSGSEIYSALREYKGDVKIHVVGMAASAASVIACSGYCEISPTAMFMIHNVSTTSSGDYHAMDKTSEVLKKVNEAVAQAYCFKTKKPLEEVLSLMDKETYLTAENAVSEGFCDKIADSGNYKLTASLQSGTIPFEVIEKMQNERIENQRQNLQNAKTKLKYLKMKGEM